MRKTTVRVTYNEEGLKRCTRCLLFVDVSMFYKRNAAKDGLAPSCKKCNAEIDRKKYYKDRKHPEKEKDGKIHCRRCDQYLDRLNFSEKVSRDGYKQISYCLECEKHMGHTYNMKRLGLSPERYVDMEKEQDYKCKICGGKDKKRLSVDHDHACCPTFPGCGNCIRGLLCSRCNRTLGMVEDNTDILSKMIKYLS